MAGVVDIVRSVTSGLAAPVLDYLKHRQEIRSRERIRKEELKDADHERQVALRRDGLTADATWELESIKAHADGWKDEYIMAVYSLPAWLCFIKYGEFDGAAVVSSGFQALSGTPMWYQVAFVSISLAPFGIRAWRRQQYDTE